LCPVLAAVIAASVLGGCAGRSSERAELTMWLVGSEAQARTINQLAESFTQRTGIRVRCEAVAWGEAHSKYLTAVAGNVEPDIGTTGLTWGAEFGRLGALIDLREAYPEDVAAIQRKTFPGLWESIEQDGRVYGIPLDVSVQVLYYRTDLIDEAPETWAELTALLEELRQQDRRMLFDWGSLSWIGYAPFLWQAGGAFYDSDGARGTLNAPAAVESLKMFRDLYTRYGVPKTSVPMEQGLRTGEFPLAVSGNWKIVSLTVGVPEIAGRWSIGLLPKGPSGRRTAFLGGRIMGIFATSPHRREAWEFVRFLFEPESQATLYKASLDTQDAYLPPNLAAWDELPMDPAFRAVLKTQAQDAKGPPAVPGWDSTTRHIETAIQRVILHGADPAVELATANAAMTEALTEAASQGG